MNDDLIERSKAAIAAVRQYVEFKRMPPGVALLQEWIDRAAPKDEQSKVTQPAIDEPVAWLVQSKRGLVRCAWTEKPNQAQIDVAEYDGDTITPLYARPASEWNEALEAAAMVVEHEAFSSERARFGVAADTIRGLKR